jgi:sec-independent protein translocase protein TatA
MPIGVPELAIILVIIVIIFGVGKLPEIGGALGKGIREFKTESTAEEKEAARLEKGNSATASTLTAASRDAREEASVRERREIRADEI